MDHKSLRDSVYLIFLILHMVFAKVENIMIVISFNMTLRNIIIMITTTIR